LTPPFDESAVPLTFNLETYFSISLIRKLSKTTGQISMQFYTAGLMYFIWFLKWNKTGHVWTRPFMSALRFVIARTWFNNNYYYSIFPVGVVLRNKLPVIPFNGIIFYCRIYTNWFTEKIALRIIWSPGKVRWKRMFVV